MPITQSAIGLVQQLKEVINQMTDLQFSQPLPVLSDSSVGQHVRHTIEFFLCLQDAAADRVLNYDNRKHDSYIEQDVKLSSGVMDNIVSGLQSIKDDFPLLMKADYQIEGSEVVEIKTSYKRELAYNIEHAIHHMALIKIGIKTNFPEVRLPEHFGVASSTVRYQKTQVVR